ncbi:MAG: response regulator transcription factor [Bacteroidales bacterium]|nr:response regulator transcription factor [Bacteroidales bacterium]
MENQKSTKVLLVDDDADIQEFMTYNLKKVGYEVINAFNGEDAIDIAEKIIPDLIILDIMMPGIDGISVCEKLREYKDLDKILICFLTARSEDFVQLAGFNAGADDYITKPIKPAIFLKKIEAMLRRVNENKATIPPQNFMAGKLKIDFMSRVVFVNKQEINLAKKEFALLKLLVSIPDKVFTREEIYNTVWGNNIIVGDRTIDVHIRKLREKLGDNYITTYKGVGYKFNTV